MSGGALVSTDSSSGRTAIIEAAGATLWFYLTHPSSGAIACDCWLANLDPNQGPLSEEERAALRDAALPLPAPSNALAEPGARLPIDPDSYRLEWSRDGDAVQASVNNEPVAFIQVAEARGFHSNIAVECPWGRPFDRGLHERLFGGG